VPSNNQGQTTFLSVIAVSNVKKSSAVLLIILSFVMGAILSRAGLRSELRETNMAVESLQDNMREYFESLNETRAIDNLETAVDLVGYVVSLNERAAPRRNVGEEYIRLLKRRVDVLDSIRPDIKDPSTIKQSELLLEKANKLMDDIEFSYL
jgi:hypothetical protein